MMKIRAPTEARQAEWISGVRAGVTHADLPIQWGAAAESPVSKSWSEAEAEVQVRAIFPAG
jgi:hypothetical protein